VRAKEIAETAVTRAGQLLQGRAVDGVDAQVAAVFWYGAVDINPKHCVVWVILRGPGSADIPPWYMVGESVRVVPGASSMKEETVLCLEAMTAEVHRAFREQSWKWVEPSVGFESDERVQAGGGWQYFK